MTTRRAFLAGGASVALGAMTPAAAANTESLAKLAARSGRFFGAAITSSTLREGGRYAELFDDECSVWVPEWEVKWGALAKSVTGKPDFRSFDGIAMAASRRGKRMRGHALVWHEHLPEGAERLSSRSDWETYVVPHIRTVAASHQNSVFHWDVVNEPIEPNDGGADGMRRTPFYRMLGADYVAEAFRLAHDATPACRLYLNEYSLCYDEDWQEKRRTALLQLIETLLAKNVPLHGIGIQGHLDARWSFSERVFENFLRQIADFGLDIAVTELDVREADAASGMTMPQRQQRAADEVKKIVSVALDNSALTGVVTWGLADHESWLRKTRPIPDNQGLPYDDRLKPAPMRTVLADLFAGAKTRHG